MKRPHEMSLRSLQTLDAADYFREDMKRAAFCENFIARLEEDGTFNT
jgi:hypothetical protein